MADAGVEAVGLPQLVARLDHARDGLLDLSTANADLVQLVLTEADPNAPRKTGALTAATSSTVTATGWGISNAKPYFLPVHWGTHYMRARPWLLQAAERTTDRQTEQLAAHVQQLLDHE